MATLKDIADICGVSTATVSYVLSGRGTEKRITEQTQQEIRKAAESLDYEYKGRNKAVLKYRVTVYFPLSGLKMLLPTFLDAFNRIVDAETSNIDILLRPYTQNQLHLQRELWASARALPPSSSPPAERIWQTSPRSRRSCRSSCSTARCRTTPTSASTSSSPPSRRRARPQTRRGQHPARLVAVPVRHVVAQQRLFRLLPAARRESRAQHHQRRHEHPCRL